MQMAVDSSVAIMMVYIQKSLVKNCFSTYGVLQRFAFHAAWQLLVHSYFEGKSIYEQLESFDNIGDYYSGDLS